MQERVHLLEMSTGHAQCGVDQFMTCWVYWYHREVHGVLSTLHAVVTITDVISLAATDFTSAQHVC